MAENKYYDQFLLNPLHYQKKKGSKHEFGIEYEPVIPKDGEIRLLGNRHRQCKYFSIGLEMCHAEMVTKKSDTFLPCKDVTDAMYRCYTEDKYGDSIRDAPKQAKPYEKKFYDCLFKPSSGVDMCMNHFSDMI